MIGFLLGALMLWLSWLLLDPVTAFGATLLYMVGWLSGMDWLRLKKRMERQKVYKIVVPK